MYIYEYKYMCRFEYTLQLKTYNVFYKCFKPYDQKSEISVRYKHELKQM